jgi:hypothetical protein
MRLHCSFLAFPSLGGQEPICDLHLALQLFNLHCLFSHPFLKSGNHRVLGSGRRLFPRRDLALRLGNLLRTQVHDAGFDGLVLIQPTGCVYGLPTL